MLPQQAIRYTLCKDIAEALAPFVAQEKSFNEWRAESANMPQFKIYVLIMALESYEAKDATLLLHDLVPNGCVRGTPTYYYQKDACATAICAAFDTVVKAQKNDPTPPTRESLYWGVRDVLAQPLLDAQLQKFFEEIKGAVGPVVDKFAKSLGRTRAEKIPQSVPPFISGLEAGAMVNIALDAQKVLLTDTFFRLLHKECEKLRGEPLNPRWHPLPIHKG